MIAVRKPEFIHSGHIGQVCQQVAVHSSPHMHQYILIPPHHNDQVPYLPVFLAGSNQHIFIPIMHFEQ